MKEYEVAILIVVRQRGVDPADAVNRIVENLSLWQGNEFANSFGTEAGVTTLLRESYVALAKERLDR